MKKELEQIVKPPIGLRPKWVSDKERLNEVRSAIVRYYDAELKIPIEWIEEYNELIGADVNIVDSDIATIEALHDLLLDAHGYSLDFRTLKKARELTAKMYKALY